MKSSEVVILSAVRTPMGSFQGELAACTTPQLGAAAIAAAVERAGVALGDIHETVMGCVLPAGVDRRLRAKRRGSPAFPIPFPRRQLAKCAARA